MSLADLIGGKYAAVPEDIRALDQWVVWRYEDRGGKKPTKVPFTPAGDHASVTNPSTWVSFSEAEAAEGFDGVGFVLTSEDDYCGVDWDDCIQDGVIDPKVLRWLDRFASYAEISPSGRGVRAFVLGTTPDGQGKAYEGLEVYPSGRYLTVTGDHIKSTPRRITAAQDVLDELLESQEARVASGETQGRVKIRDLEPGMKFKTRNPQLQGWMGEFARQGLSYEEAIDKLDELNQAHCDPPYTRKELERSFRERSYESWLEEQQVMPLDVAIPHRHFDFAAINFEVPIPEANWAWENWLAVGDLALLSGRPKLGKSWLTMGLAVAVANGHGSFLGLPCTEGPVLYVDEENPKDVIWSRVARKLGHSTHYNLRYLAHAGLRLDIHPEYLLEEALEFQPKLIVIDSLARIHTKDENSFGEMSTIINGSLKPLAMQTGASVILIHHTDKSGNGPRGSSDIEAAVDCSWIVGGEPGSQELYLKHRGGRRAVKSDRLHVRITDVPMSGTTRLEVI